MKKLIQSDGVLIDTFESVDEAILCAVKYWHEENYPPSFVVRGEEGLIAATIAPVGSDTAIVVWSHGQIDTYSQITYVEQQTRYLYNEASLYSFA